MEITKIEIVGNSKYPQCAKVYFDGHEIKGITGFRFEHNAGDLPTIGIDLSGAEFKMFGFGDLKIVETCKVEIRRTNDDIPKGKLGV